MAQILAIDYGKARCGLAVTDDFQIVASALETVKTPELLNFLKIYFSKHAVDTVVIGLPVDLRGNLSEVEQDILAFISAFEKEFPQISVQRMDERFTSKMASFYISQSGKPKNKRQEKGLIDRVSATLILQNFLEYNKK